MFSCFKYYIFPCSDETIDNDAGQKDSPVEAGKILDAFKLCFRVCRILVVWCYHNVIFFFFLDKFPFYVGPFHKKGCFTLGTCFTICTNIFCLLCIYLNVCHYSFSFQIQRNEMTHRKHQMLARKMLRLNPKLQWQTIKKCL